MSTGNARSGDGTDIAAALADASGHLTFVERLTEDLGPAPERAAAVGAAVGRVRARLVDERLRLAVVGEFSSGKSTFVNGLLRTPVLPAAVLPTTATAVTIEYGPAFLVRVRVAGDPRWHTVGPKGDPAALEMQLARLEAALEAHAHASVRRPFGALDRMLEALTTDEGVAPHLSGLRVELPAEALADGLVVIDTPGTNAEARHTDIARRVMAEEADLAVVLTSALAPVPLSLTGFLLEAFDEAALARCTYLTTYIDRVPAEDRASVVDTVRRRLRGGLGLPDPTVEPISAEAVVRLAAGRPLEPGQADWVARFEETESRLRETLARRRAVAVADSTLRLLDDAVRVVADDVEARRASLAQDEAALDAARIRDLPGFLDEYRERGEKLIGSAADKARTEIEDRCGSVRERVWRGCEERIEGAASVSALESVVNDGVTTELREGLSTLLTDLDARMTDWFTTAVDSAATEVTEAFAVEYARLGEAGVSARPAARTQAATADAADAGAGALSPVALAARTAASLDRKGRWGAGAVGMAVGAMLGGPIGAGVGAFIGGLLGGRNLAKVKAEICEQVRARVSTAFDEARDAAEQAARTHRNAATTIFHAHLEKYRDDYDSAIAEIRSEQQTRGAELERRRAALGAATAEAEHRRSAIRTQRAVLAVL
ncbi:dynamin family protein [Streptomyces sp. NPDC018964]|uniref:dynamin family protein n=1 Tax=Streptomyces sp. NPDC018964 TaxID=3365058 RepID=UPI0037B8C5F2